MYRLNCEKGEWKTSIEGPCASEEIINFASSMTRSFLVISMQSKTCLISVKITCNQPGDTANGDFNVITGSEFVFGATVLYTGP